MKGEQRRENKKSCRQDSVYGPGAPREVMVQNRQGGAAAKQDQAEVEAGLKTVIHFFFSWMRVRC
jgi:hypothetical protein